VPKAEQGHLLSIQNAVGGRQDADQPSPAVANRRRHAPNQSLGHVLDHPANPDHLPVFDRVNFRLCDLMFQNLQRAGMFARHE
jgi:hypothetical protein